MTSSLAGKDSNASSPRQGILGVDADPSTDWVSLVGAPLGWESHRFQVLSELVDGTPRLIGVRIEPRADVRPEEAVISRPLAETLPVGELAAWGALGGPVPDVRDVFAWVARARQDKPPERPRGGSDEFSEWVAKLWGDARKDGHSGLRALAVALGLPDPRDDSPAARAAGKRVERYVTEARDRGKLPPAAQRQSGKPGRERP